MVVVPFTLHWPVIVMYLVFKLLLPPLLQMLSCCSMPLRRVLGSGLDDDDDDDDDDDKCMILSIEQELVSDAYEFDG
jgi:hypothetical protein